ncbi:lamin tail domain-containing protein [Oscillochloris sp. ZM17-4]|uniref:lamin tail domain-containing protein n=1 Tax=Oscillochloris sp. ZM17-4 TaxID=2866714 RepID=UPI001C72E89A|nr:lamin tail domain-containing protein [Oscillochloris sp. ZM17-4]MBX0331092.1 lamin tail domain-containing protein [Oscillochloris sp. ZM17-4]
MPRRFLLTLVVTVALMLLASILAGTSLQAASEPLAISCPNKQTTILAGTGAPPNESLIAYLSSRPVGGGSSRSDGSWQIPLLVNERPDQYPVEVKVRGSRTIVGRFTCYVDVPLETPTPVAPEDGSGSSGASPTATATTAGGATATPARTATVVSPSRTSISATATATLTRTTPAGTATATSTSTTPVATTTSQAASATIKISDLFCRDPAYPDDSEYIELRNDGTTAVDMLGWKVINQTRSNLSYTFPRYTMGAGPDFYVTLYSGIGDNLPDFAEFYWDRTDQLWNDGDRAELRDPSGNLVDAYIVPAGCTQ